MRGPAVHQLRRPTEVPSPPVGDIMLVDLGVHEIRDLAPSQSGRNYSASLLSLLLSLTVAIWLKPASPPSVAGRHFTLTVALGLPDSPLAPAGVNSFTSSWCLAPPSTSQGGTASAAGRCKFNISLLLSTAAWQVAQSRDEGYRQCDPAQEGCQCGEVTPQTTLGRTRLLAQPAGSFAVHQLKPAGILLASPPTWAGQGR